MTSDPGSKFDFNAQAKALLKRLNPGGGGAPNPALALAAVEAALREAFARGQESARSPQPKRNLPAASSPAAPAKPAQCEHEWEEAFLDGRDLGLRCGHCGILQKDVQDHCNHYFVPVGGGEVCVACRKARGKARS